jgi:branched-chain amino acid aminotransferase
MSAKAVRLTVPLTRERLKETVAEVVRRNGYRESHIRIVITAGVGAGMGLRRTIKTSPTVLIIDVDRESLGMSGIVKSSDAGRGLRAIIASTRSIPSGCGVESRAKHNNYLNHIMVDLEAETAGADIAISLDINGFVTECSGANIYVVKNGTIATPPPYIGILAGITRQAVIDTARTEGIQFVEKLLTPYDIYTADEVFATSTVAGIASIIEVDSRTVGNGKPGPITSKIRKLYSEMLQKE